MFIVKIVCISPNIFSFGMQINEPYVSFRAVLIVADSKYILDATNTARCEYIRSTFLNLSKF